MKQKIDEFIENWCRYPKNDGNKTAMKSDLNALLREHTIKFAIEIASEIYRLGEWLSEKEEQ